MPSDKAQYVHRLGRTARAGKGGGGYLLLADFEAGFLQQLSDLPVEKREPADANHVRALTPKVNAAFGALPTLTLTCAYQAYLGFYNSYLKRLRWDREEVVRRANEFSRDVMNLPSPPALQAKTVGKMGLKGVAGLVIERGDGGGGGGGGGGGKGGGGKGGGGKGGGGKGGGGGGGGGGWGGGGGSW